MCGWLCSQILEETGSTPELVLCPLAPIHQGHYICRINHGIKCIFSQWAHVSVIHSAGISCHSSFLPPLPHEMCHYLSCHRQTVVAVCFQGQSVDCSSPVSLSPKQCLRVTLCSWSAKHKPTLQHSICGTTTWYPWNRKSLVYSRWVACLIIIIHSFYAIYNNQGNTHKMMHYWFTMSLDKQQGVLYINWLICQHHWGTLYAHTNVLCVFSLTDVKHKLPSLNHTNIWLRHQTPNLTCDALVAPSCQILEIFWEN